MFMTNRHTQLESIETHRQTDYLKRFPAWLLNANRFQVNKSPRNSPLHIQFFNHYRITVRAGEGPQDVLQATG